MAVSDYPVNHPLAVKIWSRKLIREALKQTWASKFMGTGTDSIIQIRDETQKGPGDRVTIGLRMQLTGAGVQGDGTLEGNEEALTTYTDNLFIDQLRHAVRSGGRMSEQRIPFSIREEARVGLTDWWADRIDTWFINQVTGNTSQADTRYTGNQATIAPSNTAGNTRYLFADGGSTTEASLTASQFFQLSYIDRAVNRAKTATPLIRPVRVDGDEYYAMILHPDQVTALRTDVSTGRITWFDAQKARVQGGVTNYQSSPIFNGALGIYSGVVLHESVRIPSVVASTRRAVLLGAQACAFGMGQNTNEDNPNWFEELFDYGNQLGVMGGMIAGLKKLVYNSIDFGTIVVTTYSVAP